MLRRFVLPAFAIAALTSDSILLLHSARAATPSPPAVTTVLPSNTVGVLLISTTGTPWQSLNRFNPLPQAIEGPPSLPYIPSQIQFKTDVQPWIGERAALAVLPATGQTPTERSLEESSLLVATVNDATSFKAFLEKLKASQATRELKTYRHQGIEILEWPEVKPPPPPCRPSDDSDDSCSPTGDQPLLQSSQPSSDWMAQTLPSADDAYLTRNLEKGRQKARGGSSILHASNHSSIELSQNSDSPEPEAEVIPTPIPIAQPGLAMAVLPGYVAMSNRADPLKRLIEHRQQNAPALAENSLFQSTLQNPQFSQSVVVGYANTAELSKFDLSKVLSAGSLIGFPLALLAANSLPQQLDDAAETISALDVFVWPQLRGLQTELNIRYKTPQVGLAEEFPPNPNNSLANIPASSYVLSSSHRAKQQWEQFIAAVESDPQLQAGWEQMQSRLQSLVGLDFASEVMPWMDGEQAFFLFPSKGGFFNASQQTNLGMGAVIQTSNRPTAEAALAKLDRFIQSNFKGQIRVVSRQVKGQPVVDWELFDPAKKQWISAFARTWVNDTTLAATSGAGSLAQLVPAPYISLPQDSNFQTAISPLPNPNQGYFYVNMGSVLSLLSSAFPAEASNQINPFFEVLKQGLGRIRSVSATHLIEPDKMQFSSVVILAPAR